MLFASDLIEHEGDDLRDLPLIERKRRRLFKLSPSEGEPAAG